MKSTMNYVPPVNLTRDRFFSERKEENSDITSYLRHFGEQIVVNSQDCLNAGNLLARLLSSGKTEEIKTAMSFYNMLQEEHATPTNPRLSRRVLDFYDKHENIDIGLVSYLSRLDASRGASVNDALDALSQTDTYKIRNQRQIEISLKKIQQLAGKNETQ